MPDGTAGSVVVVCTDSDTKPPAGFAPKKIVRFREFTGGVTGGGRNVSVGVARAGGLAVVPVAVAVAAGAPARDPDPGMRSVWPTGRSVVSLTVGLSARISRQRSPSPRYVTARFHNVSPCRTT